MLKLTLLDLFILMTSIAVGVAIYSLDVDCADTAILAAILLVVILNDAFYINLQEAGVHAVIAGLLLTWYLFRFRSMEVEDAWLLPFFLFEATFFSFVLTSVLILIKVLFRVERMQPALSLQIFMLLLSPFIFDELLLPYLSLLGVSVVIAIRQFSSHRSG